MRVVESKQGDRGCRKPKSALTPAFLDLISRPRVKGITHGRKRLCGLWSSGCMLNHCMDGLTVSP